MKQYLDNLMIESKSKLQKDEKSISVYKVLTEATYCSLLLFNKRRIGELQRIPLNLYMEHHNTQSSHEFEKLLTPSEIILMNSLKRIVIRGKRGRGVPVLFDKSTKEGIDLMLEKRTFFFEGDNSYLFGLPGTNTCISGYHVMRKHARNALGDADKSATLTSTKLRKHLATIAQILNMGHDELEQLAKFMGHTSKTHGEWYRLPSDIYQTAKVSKILLLAQNNSIDKYKGKNLNEIEIDNNILETNVSDGESGDEYNEQQSTKEELRQPEPSRIRKTKRELIPWKDEEKRVTDEFFKTHIKQRKAPKKDEVLGLVKMYPGLFAGRNWATIKVYVQNKYRMLK